MRSFGFQTSDLSARLLPENRLLATCRYLLFLEIIVTVPVSADLSADQNKSVLLRPKISKNLQLSFVSSGRIDGYNSGFRGFAL
jgi:hypothetical protein